MAPVQNDRSAANRPVTAATCWITIAWEAWAELSELLRALSLNIFPDRLSTFHWAGGVREVLLYIERWHEAPVQMEDGNVIAAHDGDGRKEGYQPAPGEPLFPALKARVRGSINVMGRSFPQVPVRAVCGPIPFVTEIAEARVTWGAILPTAFGPASCAASPRNEIVYCKDVNRRFDSPDIHLRTFRFPVSSLGRSCG